MQLKQWQTNLLEKLDGWHELENSSSMTTNEWVEIAQNVVQIPANQITELTNLEKLNLAREYGPLFLKIKEKVPHGKFKTVLGQLFPKISYPKANRWMLIAKQELKVAEAMSLHPTVMWGPKKMMDYLNGKWMPDAR